MTHSIRIVLGIASWLPLVSLALFYACLTSGQGGDASFEAVPVPVVAFALAMFVGLGLVVYYVLRVVRDSTMRGAAKLIWVVALSAAGVLSLPVYWYLHVWRGPRRKRTASAA